MTPKPKSSGVSSFLAMEMSDRASDLRKSGHDIISFSLGEPDFKSPQSVKRACIAAIRNDDTHYAHSQGSLELREAIAKHYNDKYSVSVDVNQILVTPGTSPALFLVFSALLSKGDEVIVTTPHYPAYTNFVKFAGGKIVFHKTSEINGYQANLTQLRKQIHKKTRAFLVTSPSNPTGTIVSDSVYRFMAKTGKYIVSDEIYHGLHYGDHPKSALNFTKRCFVVNGFSKAYAMTGYRLGYVIAPKEFVPDLKRLQQNFYISVTSFVQTAGVAALKFAEADVERMRDEYRKRRDLMVSGLRKLGFEVPHIPDGAFYVFVNVRHIDRDSQRLARDLLQDVGLAVTPGIDFGRDFDDYVRVSYALKPALIREGLNRLRLFLKKRGFDA